VDALMMGVSGLRGTIGGSLTPAVVMRWAAAYATYLKASQSPVNGSHFVVVVGRDTRPSGAFVRDAACAALAACGVAVVDLGVATTPGTAMMISRLNADAGLVITASHNPIMWNGVKLLDRRGMAPPPAAVGQIIDAYHADKPEHVRVDRVHPTIQNAEADAYQVKRVLDFVDVLGISAKRFKVVVDSVNGAGCVGVATLLSKLGCNVVHLNGQPTGQFAHEPEPTAANLTGLCDAVRQHKAHVGFAQDPDADRLAIVDEQGTYIGEEYSLALAAKYMLGHRAGLACANLSTSRMIDDIAKAAGTSVIRTPVGEANVIDAMIKHAAVIGGEGNGGVIDPRIVCGRDSLVGIAYTLGLMAREQKPVSQVVASIPAYQIIKDKFECRRQDADRAVAALVKAFSSERVDTQDGLRIDWPDAWVHARASNTEPIMRIIAEAPTRDAAQAKINMVRAVVDQTLSR
jgi:phosphomannomutase